MVEKVTFGKVFYRILRFSPVSIVPLLSHTHLHLRVALAGRTKGAKAGNVPNSSGISGILKHRKEQHFNWSLTD